MNEQNTDLAEQRLSDRLDALAESEPPAPAVTVETVIAAGRRAVRRRRARGALGLTASLAAAAALAFGVVAAAGGHGTAAPAAGRASASATAGPVTEANSPTLVFGWLPPQFDGQYQTSWYATGSNYNKPVDPTTNLPPSDGPGGYGVGISGTGNQSLTVSLTGPGSGTPPVKFTDSAGTVHGHQAWWATGAPGSTKAESAKRLYLMWQYAPDAWADMYYNGDADAAAGTMLLKVADHLVIGGPSPITLPFRFTALPGGLHADGIDTTVQKLTGSQHGSAAVRLCVQSPCVAGNGTLVVSQVSPSFPYPIFENYDAPLPNPGTAYTNVNVDGHTAQLRTNAVGATLTFSYDGTDVRIGVSGAEYEAVGGKSGFLAFCRSIDWLGGNPADWTSHYLP